MTGRRNRANQGHGLPGCLRNSYSNIFKSPSPWAPVLVPSCFQMVLMCWL